MPHEKLLYSSDPSTLEPPPFGQWWDEHIEPMVGISVTADTEKPFNACIELKTLGELSLGRCTGTIQTFARSNKQISADSDDSIVLIVNLNDKPFHIDVGTRDRQTVTFGAGFLATNSEPGQSNYEGHQNILSLVMPSYLLSGPSLETFDPIHRTITPDNEALRLIKFYMNMLMDGERVTGSAIRAHVQQTLTDLISLAFAVDNAAIDAATPRGLRSARLDAVIGYIQANFRDPNLSPQQVAASIRISVRYLHDLLSETGCTFSERLQDLRLDAALDLLVAPDLSSLRISEIAFTVGFSDLSYFNRSFRRKFGVTPTGARSH